MLQPYFSFLATPLPMLIVSAAVVLLLVGFKRHRDETGRVSRVKIVACMLLTMIAYLSLIVTMGNFLMNIPVSSIIRDGFGDQRIAWLFVGILADSVARVFALFDSVQDI